MKNSYSGIKRKNSILQSLKQWTDITEYLPPPAILCSFLVLVFIPFGQAIMCSQCDSLTHEYCESVPPSPTPCAFCEIKDTETGKCLNYTEYNFCITMKKYVNETLIRTTRSCNPISIGADCRPAIDKNKQPVKICFDSCNTDGCNFSDRVTSHWALLMTCVAVTVVMIHGKRLL
ncbi:U-scoloptoxin(05)-Sa1a-like [Liolophura sinensis]|uniref:U-scoloptoxin(05)-Sa1a-like n=1 Tax=Liolophura sinensis TaxID=3198878 RepID=UPI003159652F